MKKLLFMASLAMLSLAGCNNQPKAEVAATTATAAPVATNAASSCSVAYVNVDSLVNNYDFYADLHAAFEVKAKKIEAELTSKGRKLEGDIASFQERAQKGLMTRSDAAKEEEALQKQNQTFVEYREKVLKELSEEEQVMMNKIQYGIVDYLKVFNADFKYSMIISTTASGPVLNADPSLNITKIVLEGLNKEYAASKAKK